MHGADAQSATGTPCVFVCLILGVGIHGRTPVNNASQRRLCLLARTPQVKLSGGKLRHGRIIGSFTFLVKQDNPKEAHMQDEPVQYAGFWIRVGAAIIDTLLIMMVIFPLLIAIYGWAYFDSEQTGLIAGPADFLISWVAPASAGQLIGRYFGYYVSMIPFMLGLIWVGIDARKQGWHDKLAGTVVIMTNDRT
jgi:uncharacterized RDD family membrane protein YckC